MLGSGLVGISVFLIPAFAKPFPVSRNFRNSVYNKIRYKNDPKNPNIGFSKNEIDLLIKSVDLNLPKTYIIFLQNAGKNSNALNQKFENIEELIELQKTFKEKIENSDVEDFNFSCWCFSYFEDKYFYFELDNSKNPMVKNFENKTFPADNGWNYKKGFLSKIDNFVEFINSKTTQKYGYTLWENIKDYSMLLITWPFILIIFIILEISKRTK